MSWVILACRIFLIAAMIVWMAVSPLIWILRDGLGPDAVETTGFRAAGKFAIGWGVPALMLVVPLVGLWLLERRLVVNRKVEV